MIVLSLSAVATAVHAQVAQAEQRFTFSISSGPLSSVLARFAAQTGISLSFDASQVAPLRSSGVQGTFTVQEGLAKALENTGFDGVARTDKGFELVATRAKASRPAPLPVPASATSASQPALATPAAAASAPVNRLATVTVTGTNHKDPGSINTAIRSATRTDTPISETPQSIQVLTQETLKEQQVQSVGDALRLVSGITMSGDPGGDAGGRATVRGLTAPVLANGMLLLENAAAGMSLPMAAIDRIEVLKGADSIVAGAMKPGGAINIVSKRPQATPVREAAVQVGSYGNLLGSLDVGDVLSSDTSLSYRLIMSGERNGENFAGYSGARSAYVAPSIAWRTSAINLVAGVEKNTSRSPYPATTVLAQDGPLKTNVPLGNPNDRLTVSNTAAFYELEVPLGQSSSFHSVGRYDGGRLGNFGYQYQPFDATGLTGGYAALNRWTNRTAIALDNNVHTKIDWGTATHTLLTGFSYGRSKLTNLFADGTLFIEGSAPPDPQLLPSLDGGETRDFSRDQRSYTNTFYLQDQVAWGDWHVLLSISHGQAWTSSTDSGTRNGAWSPVIGILYQLTKQVGIYANANRSFTPNDAQIFPGDPAPPSTGRSAEAGLKASLLNDQLTGTIAFFRSREFNTLASDLQHPAFVTLVPSSSNRGFELDLNGRLMSGWLVNLSYSYRKYLNDAANSGSFVVTPDGQIVLLTDARPSDTLSVWTSYDFRGDQLRGWGIGAGVRARSSYHLADLQGGDFKLAGQAQTDLSIYYRAKKWSATLGAKNVFNRHLYGDSSSSQFIERLAPRLVTLTLSTSF